MACYRTPKGTELFTLAYQTLSKILAIIQAISIFSEEILKLDLKIESHKLLNY